MGRLISWLALSGLITIGCEATSANAPVGGTPETNALEDAGDDSGAPKPSPDAKSEAPVGEGPVFHDTEPVTAADFKAPDGIVYPNFAHAGIPGGIPDAAVVANVSDYGAVADDELDDAAAFERAIAAAAEQGGGAVLIPPGRFIFDSTVSIDVDEIVIRGSGREMTIIEPRFQGQELSNSASSVPTFEFSGDDGSHPRRYDLPLTAPSRRGDTRISVEHASRAQVGDTVVLFANPPAEVVSILSEDLVKLIEEDKSCNAFSVQYMKITQVTAGSLTVDRPVRFALPRASSNPDRPNQAATPKVSMLHRNRRRCGLEALTIEQTVDKKGIDGAMFSRTEECWMRDVAVKNIGNWPSGWEWSRNFEVRNSLFDGTRSSGGGGVGYFGVNFSSDGLVVDSEFYRLRHLSVSQASSGNVFRDCKLKNIDINLHLNWPSENLFEQCTVDSTGEPDRRNNNRGSYGYGIYTARYDGEIHCPAGPRNTFYNNDIVSYHDAVYLGGGATHRTLVTHNRFVADSGSAALIKKGSDHSLFFNNVFVLESVEEHRSAHRHLATFEGQPASDFTRAISMISGPVPGLTFASNQFFGLSSEELVSGRYPVSALKDNRIFDQIPSSLPPPPTPPAPSLYLLQR